MAASGYMTEADVESIWNTAWDTTRFDNINTRIAELLNILFNGDATTNVVATTVLPYLEQFSEELLLELSLASTAYKFTEVWNFIQSRVTDFFVRKVERNWLFIDMVSKILGKTASIELVNLSGFGARREL